MKSKQPFRFALLTVIISLTLSACNSDWMGEDEEAPLPGKRISVLAHSSALRADPVLQGVTVTIPPAVQNRYWQVPNVSPAPHLALAESPAIIDREDIGAPPEKRFFHATPVVDNGVIYTLDGEGNIRAAEQKNIRQTLWEKTLDTGEEADEVLGIGLGKIDKEFLGGALAVNGDRLYIATGRGKVLALNAGNGETIWEREIGIPVKSAPAASEESVFLITGDNRMLALDTKDGSTRWTHAGLREITSLLGASTPVIHQNVVIAPYTSGEIHVLNSQTGASLWNEVLQSSAARRTSTILLNDIDATPVLGGGMLFAVSHSGLLTAYDLRSGKQLWKQEIASVNTPWLAGDFLYVLTTDRELVALRTLDGAIKWVRPLSGEEDETFGDPEDAKRALWTGPVLAGGNLYVVGSHGRLVALSPKDGSVRHELDVPSNITLPPIAVDGILYLLSNDAELIALQ